MTKNEKKYHFIYKTTNLKTGKFYVGIHSTNNLNDGYLGSGTRLRRSIRRNGKENFKIEHLQFFDNRTDLVNREKELVNEELLKDAVCMNLKPGGTGGFNNKEHEERFKNASKYSYKIALENGRNKMKWLRENDAEWYDRWQLNKSKSLKGLQTFLGKTHKEETKIKIGKANSLKQKGNANSQFGTCWITDGLKNKKIHKNDVIPKGWSLGRKM